MARTRFLKPVFGIDVLAYSRQLRSSASVTARLKAAKSSSFEATVSKITSSGA